jgi:hypothetical protein
MFSPIPSTFEQVIPKTRNTLCYKSSKTSQYDLVQEGIHDNTNQNKAAKFVADSF